MSSRKIRYGVRERKRERERERERNEKEKTTVCKRREGKWERKRE